MRSIARASAGSIVMQMARSRSASTSDLSSARPAWCSAAANLPSLGIHSVDHLSPRASAPPGGPRAGNEAREGEPGGVGHGGLALRWGAGILIGGGTIVRARGYDNAAPAYPAATFTRANNAGGMGYSNSHVMLMGRSPRWERYRTGPRKV